MNLNANEEGLLNEKRSIIVFLFLGILVFESYKIFLKKEIRKNGVYVKAEIIDSKGNKGGVTTTVKYFFNGHLYEGRVSSSHGKEKVGTIYILKLLPNDPTVIALLDDKPVPDCLFATEVPLDGWKEIPGCK